MICPPFNLVFEETPHEFLYKERKTSLGEGCYSGIGVSALLLGSDCWMRAVGWWYFANCFPRRGLVLLLLSVTTRLFSPSTPLRASPFSVSVRFSWASVSLRSAESLLPPCILAVNMSRLRIQLASVYFDGVKIIFGLNNNKILAVRINLFELCQHLNILCSTN